jgi:uncharacterized protein (UPF0332 family)
MNSNLRFDWLKYLIVASDLSNVDPITFIPKIDLQDVLCEAKCRCAISRAYYSIFCSARNYLRDVRQDQRLKRKPEAGFNVHQHVISELLADRTDGNIKRLGQNLDRLRTLRNEADYDDFLLTYTGKTKQAFQISKASESILNNLFS